jgi:hypothetical protein
MVRAWPSVTLRKCSRGFRVSHRKIRKWNCKTRAMPDTSGLPALCRLHFANGASLRLTWRAPYCPHLLVHCRCIQIGAANLTAHGSGGDRSVSTPLIAREKSAFISNREKIRPILRIIQVRQLLLTFHGADDICSKWKAVTEGWKLKAKKHSRFPFSQ